MGNEKQYKWDIHTHSGVSSHCSYEDPKNLAIAATQRKLDGLCITDHCPPYGHSVTPGFYLDVRQFARERHLGFILGREIKLRTDSTINDYLIFHPDERTVFDYDVKFEDMTTHFVEEFRSSGGILILAHPWEDPTEALPIDAIETQNSRFGGEEFQCRTSFCKGLARTGGSDAHVFNHVGVCYTIFEKRIECAAHLVTAIKEKKCSAAADKQYFRNPR